MDWKRGLFRLWVLGSILWLLVTGYSAVHVFLKPAPFGGNYQYVEQTKEVPRNVDWSKPYYDIICAPGKGRFADEFSGVDDYVIQDWDKSVKIGDRISVEFPDFTVLYLSSALIESDREYLCGLFWQQRWWRYSSKISYWLSLTFGPPLVALFLGRAIGWVLYGFVRPKLADRLVTSQSYRGRSGD